MLLARTRVKYYIMLNQSFLIYSGGAGGGGTGGGDGDGDFPRSPNSDRFDGITFQSCPVLDESISGYRTVQFIARWPFD
ncbi:unnamed protein product [Echinostoma caproni]|uniref:Uncharacterized protein n=1 Tax=Echinostoma caproni TaxID=27848 RepID=A0A183B4P8_9TREM|nr:unnamed protein product [Echinostoma caproni]